MYRIPSLKSPNAPELGYWEVVVSDPVSGVSKEYNSYTILNAKLTDKICQVPIFDVDIPNISGLEYQQFWGNGRQVQVHYDGELVFVGSIQKGTYTTETKSIHAECNGVIHDLSDQHNSKAVEFSSETASTILGYLVAQMNAVAQPQNDPWMIQWADPTLNDTSGPFDFFSYTYEINDYLTHLKNIMALIGNDWTVRYGDGHYVITLLPTTSYRETSWAGTIELLDTYDIVLSATTMDTSKIKNQITVTGATDTNSQYTGIFSNYTRNIGYMASNETYLADNLSATDLRIYVKSHTGFDRLGGQVQIDNEIIWYDTPGYEQITLGDGSSDLKPFIDVMVPEGGLPQRGYRGTGAAAHAVFSPVVICDDLDLFVDSGNTKKDLEWLITKKVWIGKELVGFEEALVLDGTELVGFTWEHYKLQNVTRGLAGGSTPYPHSRGIAIRDTTYSEQAPEGGSSIALYGVRGDIHADIGSSDQDALDRVAQNICLLNSYLKPWGTGTLRCPAITPLIYVGGWITLKIFDPTTYLFDSADYRIVGLEFNQASSKVVLYYGDTEEYILNRMTAIDTALNLARQVRSKPVKGTIVETAQNGAIAKVNIGTESSPIYRWVQLR